MNVSLTPTLEAFVREKVGGGLYNNASEVVREALRRWIEEERRRQPGSQHGAVAPLERRLAPVIGRLRALGVRGAAVVGAAALGPLPHGQEAEVLLDLDPEARFTVVDLASVRSLCEGASGGPVKVLTSGGLDAKTRRSLERDAVKIF